MKAYKLLTLIILSALFLQSCERLLTGRSNKNKVHGTVTDKETGEAIKDVKLTIYIEDFDRTNGEDEVTEHFAYTDDNGDYDLKFKREDGTHYYIKPTHEDYVYGIKNGWYPNLENGLENEINFEMEKRGVVKIKGDARFEFDDTFVWLENVRIFVLKRVIGNTNYPESIGIETYTNNLGEFNIEFEGDEEFEFFLKPEKTGYYYEWNELDYLQVNNVNPGYEISVTIVMKIHN
ncbi:MAG: hypothetical protein K8R54_09960 [Bacteroidales bacterium]|nr:hypothetical protein [Bacteroidales bacterium]